MNYSLLSSQNEPLVTEEEWMKGEETDLKGQFSERYSPMNKRG